MKKHILFLLVFCFLFGVSSGQARQRYAVKKGKPGKWATSFIADGGIVTSTSQRRTHRAGLGGAFRVGYGFWEGISVEGDFAYDLLFVEDSKGRDNLHLISLNTGMRYSRYILQDDLSLYASPLVGLTIGLEDNHDTLSDFSYVLAAGLDAHVTDRLSLGPVFRYRHVLAEVDIHLINLCVCATYLFK